MSSARSPCRPFPDRMISKQRRKYWQPRSARWSSGVSYPTESPNVGSANANPLIPRLLAAAPCLQFKPDPRYSPGAHGHISCVSRYAACDNRRALSEDCGPQRYWLYMCPYIVPFSAWFVHTLSMAKYNVLRERLTHRLPLFCHSTTTVTRCRPETYGVFPHYNPYFAAYSKSDNCISASTSFGMVVWRRLLKNSRFF